MFDGDNLKIFETAVEAKLEIWEFSNMQKEM